MKYEPIEGLNFREALTKMERVDRILGPKRRNWTERAKRLLVYRNRLLATWFGRTVED